MQDYYFCYKFNKINPPTFAKKTKHGVDRKNGW